MTNSLSFSINLQFLVWYFRIFFPFQSNIIKHFSLMENSRVTEGHTHCSYATGSSLIDIIYMYCHWRSSYQEERVGIPLTSLTLSIIFLCLSQTRTWISYVIFCGLFCIQWVQFREVIVCLVDIGGICLNFFFIILV